jgi:hypothetical protein
MARLNIQGDEMTFSPARGRSRALRKRYNNSTPR